MLRHLEAYRSQLAHQGLALRSLDPPRSIGQARQRLDGLENRLHRTMAHRLAVRRTALLGLENHLKALDPTAVLERGYAIVEDRQTGMRIQSVAHVRKEQDIRVHVSDGHIDARVAAKARHKRPLGREEE